MKKWILILVGLIAPTTGGESIAISAIITLTE